MAIAFVNSTFFNTVSSAASYKFPVTVLAGDDRILVVKVALGLPTGTMPTVSTVTYGAQSLTKTDGAAADMVLGNTDDTEKSRIEIWKVVAPNVGTNEVTVTLSAGTAALRAGNTAETWTGVDQTTPLGTFASASSDDTGTTATPTVDVTSAAGEYVTDIMADEIPSSIHSDPTVGAGQTEINDQAITTIFAYGSSYEAGAATTTMSWTTTSAASVVHHWAIGGVPLKPSSATSSALDSSTTIAELSIAPLIEGPRGFTTSSTAAVAAAENQQPSFEAGGLFPKVYSVHLQGEDYIWDDIYTIPSVGNPGKLAISALPTPNSPNGSLIVTTQDALLQYPLPYSGEPSLTDFPNLATSSTSASHADIVDFVPVFFPQPIDLGALHEVAYVECFGEDFVEETDAWGVTFKWDENNRWETAKQLEQNHALFRYAQGSNKGCMLHPAFSIIDGANTDLVPPTGRMVVYWVRPLEGEATELRQPTVDTQAVKS